MSVASLPFGKPRRLDLRLFTALVCAAVLAFLCASPYLVQVLGGLAAKAEQSGRTLPPLWVVWSGELIKVLVIAGTMAALGTWAAPRVGLDAPLFRARLEGERVGKRVLALVLPGLAWGTAVSLAVFALHRAMGPVLPEALRPHAPELSGLRDRLVGFGIGASSAFYGGVVEELLLRWGLLSALALLALKARLPRPAALGVGLVLSTLLFAAGHLPLAVKLAGWSPAVVLWVLLGNSLAGLVFGVLYVRRGLEQAMIAHAWGDVCLHALPFLLPGFAA